MWDKIFLDFGEEETVNFGPRKELIGTSHHLYETHTVATILSTTCTEVKYVPAIVSQSSQEFLAVAIDTSLSVFKNDFSEVWLNLSFDGRVENIAISEDSQLLIIGEHQGSLNVFYLPSKRHILVIPKFITPVDNEETFNSILFTYENGSLNDIQMVIYGQRNLFVFSQINLEEIRKAACEENWTSIQQHLLSAKQYQFTLSELYPACQVKMIFHVPKQSVHLYLGFCGSGTQPLAVGLIEDWNINFACVNGGSSFKKAEVSSDGRYIFALDYENVIHIICSRTLILLRTLKNKLVTDFSLVETADPRSGAVIDMKLLCLVNCEDGLHFEVVQFPTMLLLYSLKVSPIIHVVNVLSNQENFYIVEGVLDEQIENGNRLSFRIRRISEALPEARLARLLRKQMYDEAEEFALLFDLDVQDVYKAKSVALMDTVSPWLLEPLSLDAAEKVLLQAKAILGKIKDVRFVIESCLNATPTSARFMEDLLHYAKKNVIKGQCVNKETWLIQINEALRRLVTFETLYPAETDWRNWFRFKQCNLFQEFLQLLQNERTAEGFSLWENHKAELSAVLTDDNVTAILHSIPENVSSKELSIWLQDSLLVPVLYMFHSSIEELSKWLIQRAKILEISEKDDWPENSLRLLEILPHTCERILSVCQQGIPNVATELSSYLLQRKAESSSSSLHALLVLITDLKELALLRKNFKCPLSSADFCQEDKISVAFLILDWLVGTKYMDAAINSFFIRFIKSASLNADYVFLLYIKETLLAFPVGWWHWEEAPWEERVFHVLKYINNPEQKLTATFTILAQSPVPWSPKISALVEEQMENLKGKAELETHKRLAKLKVVLLKYNIRDYSISNSQSAERLMRFILEQSKPTALEDALLVTNSFGHLNVSDAYFAQMVLFLKKDNLDDFTNLLERMSGETLQTCVRRLIALIDGLLLDSMEWQDKNYVKAVTYGGLHSVKYLLQVLLNQDNEFQPQLACLQRVWRLQVEYGLYQSLNDVDSLESCWEILNLQMEKLISGHTSTGEMKRGSTSFQPTCSDIYRLGYLLGLPKDEITGRLAIRFAEKRDMLKAVSLCKEISSCYSKTAPVLLNVVKHFYENLHAIQDSVTAEMFQAIYETITHAAASCDFDIMPQCINVAAWTSLLCSLCTLDNNATDFQQHNWRFSCLYQDHGLRIERKHYLPQLVSFVNKICFGNDDAKGNSDEILLSISQVIAHLRSKGQEAAALGVLLLTAYTTLPHLVDPTQNEEVCHTMVTVNYAIIKSLLSRIVKMKVVDKNLALDLLCTLESNALQCFKELLHTCGGEFGRLMSIASVGVMYGDLEMQPKIVEKCRDIYKNASWGGRLSNLEISSKDVQMLESNEHIGKVLCELFVCPDTDLSLILEFCKEFRVSKDEALYEYLRSLLLGSKIQDWSVAPEKKAFEIVEALILKAESIIDAFNDKNILIVCLQEIVEKLNPYCYELIEFVLKHLTSLSSDRNREKGLKLIRFLKIYKRANRAPTDIEMDNWLNNDNNQLLDQLPRLATVRLPFNELIGPNMWKIVSGELSASNIELWLTIASLLKLERDQMLVISVQNTFTKWIAKHHGQLSTSWQMGYQLLEVLHRLGSQITDIEVAIACSNWILKRLPIGAMKVQVAKAAVGLARRWVLQSRDEKSQECLRKLTVTYHRLATEQVLHDYGFTDPEYFALSQKPSQLIIRMLEKSAGDDKILTCGYSQSVHSAVKEIEAIGDCSLGELCNTLLENWLPHLESIQNAVNETATLNFSWANVQSFEAKDDSIINLNRIINLLQYAPLEDSIIEQLGVVLKESPMATTPQKVQALRCLLIVADEQTIERVNGHDSQTTRKMLQELMFVTQLEAIQLPYSLEMFQTWNKQHLVESILQLQNPKAVMLASSLCMQYKLWDENLWEIILGSMVELHMTATLELVLMTLGSKSFLWHKSGFVAAWNCILKAALQKEPLSSNTDNQAVDTYFKMMSCPCIMDIDLNFFSNEFESHGCIIPAIACTLIKQHTTNSFTMAKSKLADIQEKLARLKGFKHRLLAFSRVFQFAVETTTNQPSN